MCCKHYSMCKNYLYISAQFGVSKTADMSVCVCPSVRPSVCVRPSVHLSVCVRPSVHLSICLSVCLCLSARPSFCLCLPVSARPSVCLSVCLCLSIRPSVCLSVCPLPNQKSSLPFRNYPSERSALSHNQTARTPQHAAAAAFPPNSSAPFSSRPTTHSLPIIHQNVQPCPITRQPALHSTLLQLPALQTAVPPSAPDQPHTVSQFCQSTPPC